MGFTPEQIKGRIKSIAKQNNADARTLMRIYMMERFLERLAQSEYRDNFIIKGGILVTAMIGVAHRSTMDIDTSMKNLNLSADDALQVVNQVKDIDLDDGVSFEVKDVSNIMDEMEYPGIRVTMNANVGRLITPLKIDISTGDVITPRAIEFNYDLLLEDRSISLWSYNLETILAEKLQTVLARGILNTRMVMWMFDVEKGVVWKSTKLGLIFSVSIEMLQLLLRLGTFQVSDIVYNTLGGMLGGLCYKWERKYTKGCQNRE